jgi:hypothetical protein
MGGSLTWIHEKNIYIAALSFQYTSPRGPYQFRQQTIRPIPLLPALNWLGGIEVVAIHDLPAIL